MSNNKITLSDSAKKLTAESVKDKRDPLVGKNWDDLKAAEKDALLKAVLEKLEWLKDGIVV
jgi:hypothetical protein